MWIKNSKWTAEGVVVKGSNQSQITESSMCRHQLFYINKMPMFVNYQKYFNLKSWYFIHTSQMKIIKFKRHKLISWRLIVLVLWQHFHILSFSTMSIIILRSSIIYKYIQIHTCILQHLAKQWSYVEFTLFCNGFTFRTTYDLRDIEFKCH
jgi:hypothetical protein